MHVEVDVIILRKRVKIGEIHIEQVLRLEGAEGSHGRRGEEDGWLEFFVKEEDIYRETLPIQYNMRLNFSVF